MHTLLIQLSAKVTVADDSALDERGIMNSDSDESDSSDSSASSAVDADEVSSKDCFQETLSLYNKDIVINCSLLECTILRILICCHMHLSARVNYMFFCLRCENICQNNIYIYIF